MYLIYLSDIPAFNSKMAANSLTSISQKNELTNVLTIKTIQILPIRTLMTALKDILGDTNITFTPEGMKIINTDKSHTTLVHLFLEADNFEFYECKKEKIIIGVNIVQLYKLINTIESNDTLTIYIDENDYVDGIISHLSLKFEYAEIRRRKIKRLRLIEPDHEELEFPDVSFSSILHMPSISFQKNVKSFVSVTDKLEIISVGNELIYKADGPFADIIITTNELEGNMEFVKQPDASEINQGIFSIRHLNSIIKCTHLCDQIEMYIENDLPLVVKYNVASLGMLKLCIAPLPSS